MKIFRETVDIEGTPASKYLEYRGIHLDAFPVALRFHPECPFGGERVPCMVALVQDIKNNEPIAIHRTAIKADGCGKYFDDGRDNKLALGPVAGGVIKLTPDDAITMGLGIAEGIETALNCMAIGWPMWSCLSASGIAKFPVLAGIDALTIFCDHDKSGTGERAAVECGVRWRDAGRDIKINRPKGVGTDWNDALKVAYNGD